MKKFFAFFLGLGLFFSFNQAAAQVANDNCATAAALTLAADEASAVPTSGTTTGATQSTAPTSVCSGSWFADDVWYTVSTGATAPPAGITIKVAPGTMSLLGMAVYLGCGATQTPISCFSQCNGSDAMVLPFAQANTTYYIRLWSGCSPTANAGTFNITAFQNPIDPNALVDVVLWGNNPGEGDFGGSLSGWTTTATNPADQWIWDANASANGAFRTTVIVSPTAYNGAALFDADFMTTSVNPSPVAPYPVHLSDLLSPIIDCSTFSSLAVKFYQSYDALNGDTYFSYSTDGGNTFSTPVNINPSIAGNGTTPAPSVVRVDMPGAAGSNQVQLKFTGDMDFYNWIIDDVQLVQKEINNLGLANDFIAIAPTYAMPKSSVDTIRFLADVANIGANAQYNVALGVQVVRNSDNAVVFSATNSYGTMMAGDTVENQAFSSVFVPDTLVETYTVTYNLTSDSTDVLPSNNTFTYTFEVVEDFFAKEPTFSRNITPAGNNSYTYGTHYYVHNGQIIDGTNNLDTLSRIVSSISFGVSNPTELVGQSVTIYLERANPNNANGRFDVDGGGITSAEREIVAFGSYTFTGTEPTNDFINVPVDDFNTGGPYTLQSNTHYAAMINFIAPDATTRFRMLAAQSPELNYNAANFAAGLNGVERYSQLLDVGNSGTYSTVGFAGSPVPAVRINFLEEFTTSTAEEQLPETAFTVFPNPADDFITVDLQLENMSKEARFAIYNVTGQILETRSVSNIQNEKVLFPLDGYSSGVYFISVDTDFGRSIKRFVVK